MAKRSPKGKVKGSAGGGGLVALIKSVVSSYVKDTRGRSAPIRPRNATEAFYQKGAQATIRDVYNSQATTVEPPNRPPMRAAPGMAGRINPMGRLTVPGAEPVNRPPLAVREYSRLTRSIGGSILRDGDAPPEVMRAALDAVDGTGNRSDKELLNYLRGSLGIQKTGATELNTTLRSFNRGMRELSHAAVLSDVSSRGGPQGTAAKLGLLQMAMSKGAEFAQSSTMKSILTTALGGFAGRRAFIALGAGVRMANPFLAGAIIGGTAGNYIYDNTTGLGWLTRGGDARLAQLQGSKFDVNKNTRMDPRLTRAIEDEQRELEIATGSGSKITQQEAINKRRDAVVNSIVGMRSEAQALGIDVNGALSNWAAEHHIDPSQMTAENKAAVIDIEIKKRRDALMRRTPDAVAFIKNKIANMSAAEQADYWAAPASVQRLRDAEILTQRVDVMFDLARRRSEMQEADYEAFISRFQAENNRMAMGGRLGVVNFSEMQIKLREFETERQANTRRHQVVWDD